MDTIQLNANQFNSITSSPTSLPFNNLEPFNFQFVSSNALTFSGTDQIDALYLKVGVGQVLEYSTDGSYFFQVNGLKFSHNTHISVNLGSGNDGLYVDSSLINTLNSTGTKFSFDGGQGKDTIFGPNLDTTWYITGQDTGKVSGIEFNNVENLKAAANNYATFVFTPDGNLSGVADGGDGNLGTLVLEGGSYSYAKFIADGPHSGEILLDTKTIRYAGLAPIFDNTITADRVFTATNGSDQILIKKATTGKTTIFSSNGTFESITFSNPSNSLTIRGLQGNDTITLDSIDANFTKSLTIDDGDGNDSVIFAQNLTLNGGNLTVNAESINILDNVNIFTAGDVTFEAKNNSSALLNLLPGNIVNIQKAEISLGNNVSIQAGNITLKAEAQDENPTDKINSWVKGFLVQPLIDYGTAIASLPVDFAIRESSASVILGNNAKLTTSGDIDISATAKADSTSKVLNQFFSIGYSSSNATATTTIGQGTVIKADGDVNILSDANSVAGMTTRTLKNLGAEPTDPTGVGLSLAIANAKLTSKTTVSQGAEIEAGGNVNIVANGKTEREASAEVGSFGSSGRGGISLALGFSKADVNTFVNGKVISGSSLQHEFDPGSAVNDDNDTITILKHGFKDGQAVIYKNNNEEDSNIGDLEDSTTYYVKVLDENTIKLAESSSDLEDEKFIDLKNTGVQGKAHILKDPGIRVIAQLESEDAADATSGVGGDPSIADNIEKPEIAVSAIIGKLTEDNYSKNSNSGGSGGDASVTAAGAFVFSKIDNNVTATTGSNAVLQSQADVSVQASISEKIKTAAEAATEDAEGSNGEAKKASASAAVIVGLYSNNAQTTIESNAVIDASKDTRITSEVSYPFRIEPQERFVPSDVGAMLKEEGFGGVTGYLDGKLGIQSELLNSWAVSTSETDGEISLAGSVNYQQFTNNSQAIVKSGAKINQNQDIRPESDDQTVSVEATTEMELINVTGVFKFDLSIESVKELIEKRDPLAVYNPVGSSGGKGGVGGAFFLMFNDSTTIAKVETGTSIYTGAEGGLTINAESTVFDLNLGQAGGGGGKFGVGGTFSYTNQESKTIAQLESGAKVTGGSLEITANDETLRITAVGGVAKSENLGIGMSVTVNEMDRETLALIGNQTGAAGIGTDIEVEGDITVEAKADGGLWAFSLAAAVVKDKPPEQPSEASTDQLASAPQPDLSSAGGSGGSAGSNDQGNQGKSGIGISGDVSINNVKDKVSAYINDAGKIKGETVNITAVNDSDLRSVSGAVSFSVKKDPNSTSAGIAGSFSMNTLTGTTTAYISGIAANGDKLTLEASQLSLSATRSGDLFALSAGGAAAPGQKGFAVSGSVSLNKIANTTEAAMTGTNATIAGDVGLNAQDNSSIFAIGGALSFGGKAGFGAAIALNRIKNTTKAIIQDSTLDHQGKLELSAINESSIKAITASLGISTQQSGAAGAGTVSLNFISNSTEAAIINTQKGSATATGIISLIAKDNSDIANLAGAVGLSGGKAGFGAAVAYNSISNSVKSYIQGSTLSTQGELTLQAESEAEIQAIALGVGGGKDVGLGGSVAINLIGNTTEAYLNSANITADGQNNISASDNSTIQALAGGVGVGQKAGIGAGIGVNQIGNSIKAYISNSTLTSNNAVSLSALATSTIEAISIGGGAADKFALGGSVSVNNIGTQTLAYISNNSTVEASQGVTVQAIDDSNINSFAGTIAGSGNAAIGASVSTNNVNNKVSAYISASQVTSSTSNVLVNADLTALVRNATVGGTGAGSFALGGSVTVNNIGTVTEAYISNGATVNADQEVEVLAYDNSDIESLAGQLAIGGVAGVGASVSTNNVNNKTNAYISNCQVTSSNSSVTVKADSSPKINNITAGGVGGGTFAFGGSVTVNNIGTQTLASISNNSLIQARQNIAVLATNNATIKSLAGQVSAAGTAAIGAAVAVNNYGGKIAAYINDSEATSTTGQIKVVAKDTSKIESLSAGASVSGNPTVPSVSLTGSVSVNNISNTVDAHILNAEISANSLEIAAKNDATIKSLAGQISISISGGAVGAAVAYNNIGSNVKAYVAADDGNFTNINTSGNTSITATSKGTIETIAAGGSAGLFVGAGASVAVNQMSNNISAFVHNSNIKAQGSVAVLADSTNSMTTKGGTFAAGFVGAGGTIAVNNLNNTTRAYANNATVTGVGEQSITIPKTDGSGTTETFQGVAVLATSKDNLDVTIGTAGGGFYTFVASVAVNSFQNTTEAYVQDVVINASTGSSIPQQSTYIKAFNDSTVNVNAGTAGGGLAAAGVGIDITTMKNVTTAYINSSDLINSQGSIVNANKDLVVEAKTQKSLTSNVLAFGGGLGFSVQGAVSIINVSSGISSDALTATSDTESIVTRQLTDLNSMGKDSNGKSTITTRGVSSNFSTSQPNVQGTTAFIAGSASAGSNLIVNAYETTKLNISVGSLSAGLLSVGGAVGIANITHNASAYVADRSILIGGDITIQSTGFVNSTTVKAVAGTEGGVRLGAAVSYLDSQNNSKAYIGDNTAVMRANNLDVIATSSSNLNAQGLGASYGLAVGGIVIANAQETGKTQAYLNNGVQVDNTDNLNVKAIANEAVTAIAQASSGGIVSGNGTETKANVNPNVSAYIGNNNNIKVAKDVNVLSNVSVDGDAASKGRSYGALAAGLAFSKVNSNPTINTYVDTNTTIAAGNVTISSSLGKAPVAADTSFNPANAVNNGADSVTFANNHGLSTGDTVVYSNGGGSNIGGLTNDRSYSVIVVDDKTIKLGSEFNAATVDTKFNTLKFANGHSFEDKQQVVYEAKDGSNIGGLISGEKYYVKVIDGSTVQLSKTPVVEDFSEGARLSGITTVGSATTIVSSNNNDFANGDTVVYKKRSASFTVDKAENIPSTGSIFNSDTGDIVSKDTINSESHGFETGDQVVYTATGSALGGLTDGAIYYVKKVDDNKFQLSTTNGGPVIDITNAAAGTSHKITAVGLKTANIVNFTYSNANASNQITVVNHGFTSGQAVLYTGTPQIGLTNGATYYVIKVDDNNFRLAATSGGTAISLTGATGSNSLKAIGQELEEGVTYYVINSTSTSFQLSQTKGGQAIALDQSGLTGEGVNHIFVRESVVDLTSKSTGMHNLHIDLENGTATGDKHQLSSGASIVLPSQGDQVFSAYSQASSGAVLAGSGAKAKINITSNMNTYIGNAAVITATGNVKVQGQSNIQLTGAASTKTGGIVGVGVGELTAKVVNNNKTTVFKNATIQAAGNVTIDGQSVHKFNISSDSTAGGLIPIGRATATLNLTHNTITEVADQANITSQRNILVSSSSDTTGSVKADASGGGFIPFAYGTANLIINGANDTNVNAATLEGRKLTVESAVDNLNVNALGLAKAGGLIGIIQAKSNIALNETRATTNIGSGAWLKADELNLNAVFRNVNTNSTALAHCDGLGGKTDSDAINNSNLKATVNTNANSTLTVNSLNVKSGFDSFNNIYHAYSKKAWKLKIWLPFIGTISITMDFGRAKPDGSQNATSANATSTTDFNSNVVRLARQVNPVVVIDASGKVALQSENVTVDNGTDIKIGNINATGGGKITFSTGAKSTGGSFVDRGKYSMSSPAFDTVEIQNYSHKNLIINDIRTISSNSGSSAPDYSQVNVDKATSTTTSSGSLAANPTLVTINNWGASNLILQGVIDNPHDRTILYSGGNIFSQGTTQQIITRDLKMTAAKSIGTDNQRITAQLIQGYNPVTADVADSNIYLNVEAQNSTYLNLAAKALDSNPVTVNVQRMTANTGDVNLAIAQTTNQANTAIPALYKFNNFSDSNQGIIAGKNIVINAGTTTTDIDAKTIFLTSTGSLDVVTGGSINVKNLAGTVNLQRLISDQDAVNLSGRDLTLVDNSLLKAAKDVTLTVANLSMLNNANLSAGNNVNLLVENNFDIGSSATINAGNEVVIQGDYNNRNIAGASINIDGWIYAQQMSIYTQDNNDILNIRRLATATNIYTGGGDDVVNIGSSQNRTNEIQKRLTIYGESQSDVDTLNIDNSGDISNSIGILTNTSLTGLGIGEGIYYNGFEVFNLKLGTGNDDFTILNTSATTNIDSGLGDDRFRVGPKVDANGNVLDEIVNGVWIPGFSLLGIKNNTTIRAGNGNDYIQVNRNTAELNIYGEGSDDTFEVNTPINYSISLSNAQVNISGGDGNDKTVIKNSSLLEPIINNGSSVEVVNSRLINLMMNEVLVINGTPSGSNNTNNSINNTLASLYDRSLVNTNTTSTNTGSRSTLSSLYDRNSANSSGGTTNNTIDPWLLSLFSR